MFLIQPKKWRKHFDITVRGEGIMKILILMGSPRKEGNTAQLTEPFINEAKALGAEVETVWLYGMNIQGCISCRSCQKEWDKINCAIKDDMGIIFDKVQNADIIVLATPIYSWYCTAPMKAVLDRLVYGMNKYYGDKVGPSLFEGKKMAIITTCGYKPDRGADLFEEGMKRYCKHSHITYLGMLAERFLGYKTVFMDETKAEHAREFAKKIISAE